MDIMTVAVAMRWRCWLRTSTVTEWALPFGSKSRTISAAVSAASHSAASTSGKISSDWHPGFRLPLHKHPDGHEFTFVVEGEQTFEVAGMGTKVVKAGEVIYTPPNVAHFGRNATDKISKTVVFRIKPKDQPITVNVPQ